jgi:hypothetical protein
LQVLQRGIELREHEDVFVRKDGSFFPVVLSSSPLKISGAITGIVVCFRDDTRSTRIIAALPLPELETVEDKGNSDHLAFLK